MIYNTTMRPNVAYSQTNTLNYAINQALLNVNTVLPCKILLVNTNNTYNIQSIINYIDAGGNSITPSIIYNVPVQQSRGGNAGIITKYKKDDIVAVGFCQRDISLIKSNWQQDMPNSLRKFSLSDGIILGYLSNDLPTTYISITDTGIEIVSNNLPINMNSGTADTIVNCNNANITATSQTNITAPTINLNGNVVCNSTIQAVNVTATSGVTTPAISINGQNFTAHTHSGVQTGGGNTGGVNP